MIENKIDSFVAFHYCDNKPEMKLIGFETIKVEKSTTIQEEYEMNFHPAA